MNSEFYLIVKKKKRTQTTTRTTSKVSQFRSVKGNTVSPKPYCVTACFFRLVCAMVFNFPPTFFQFEQLQTSEVSDLRNHWLLRCLCGCRAVLY